jgi:hypothetical protein
LILYPQPSINVGLLCDGTRVNSITLGITPVSDAPILEAPEEMKQAIDEPVLQVPTGVGTWLDECLAAGGAGAMRPKPLRLDSVVMRCIGTAQAPEVKIDFLTQAGKRHASGRKCQSHE